MHLSDLSTQASLRIKTEKAAQRLHGVSKFLSFPFIPLFCFSSLPFLLLFSPFLFSSLFSFPKASQPVQESTSGVYEDKFHIYPECIGFAMGRQGWNVNQARQIPGIISIDFDDYGSTFTVRAEVSVCVIMILLSSLFLSMRY